MTIAVMSAMRTEVDLLLDALDDARRADVGGWPVWSGEVGPSSVVIAKAGLGKVNTAALTALLWQTFSPSLFIFTGVAGGLDPTLGIGDVVVGTRTIQHDSGVLGPKGLERYQAGHIPFFNPTDDYGFVPSPSLIETMKSAIAATALNRVLDRMPTVVFGTILTGDVFLQDDGARDRLHDELDALAVEMEGAAMAQVATSLAVDHLVVRSISDLAAGDAEKHFDRFVVEASANSARLVLALLIRL